MLVRDPETGVLKSVSSTTTPSLLGREKQEEAEEEKFRLFPWVGKQLMKPVGVSAKTFRGTGRAAGSLLAIASPKVTAEEGLRAAGGEIAEATRGIGRVLAGREETSFGRELKEAGAALPGQKAFGLAADITLDPLNLLGGGLTKAGRVAKQAGRVLEAGEEIKKGSELAQQLTKFGVKPGVAGTKAEQVRKGQRALFQIAGKPVVRGEKFYETTEKLGGAIKATKPAQAVKKLFSTSTSNKAFDEMRTQIQSLGEYRISNIVEKGKGLSKQLRNMAPEEVAMISEVIENPELRATATEKVLQIADSLDEGLKGMANKERALGVLRAELDNYFPHIRTKESLGKRMQNWLGGARVWNDKLASAKHREIGGTIQEINEKFGKEFFQTNPAVAYTTRGVASSKAITGAEFLERAKEFGQLAEKAPVGFVESTAAALKGLKFEPEVAKAVDAYVETIKPDDINAIFKGFDTVQNWWKMQALVAPSYHVRNMVGNYWNNFLAGVKNPARYLQSTQLMSPAGRKNFALTTGYGARLSGDEIMDVAKKTGVLDMGLYAKEIEEAIDAGMTTAGRWNPLSQNNFVFKTNRAVGSFVENNARLTHFIDRLAKGDSVPDAAASVKKYLFDYGDLTDVEKRVFKRIAPFYTWTRKNIPRQLEHLVKEPEKFAAIYKIKNLIEGDVEKPDERFLSDYIKDNIAVRLRTDEAGNTQYFLLGNWLPAAQALDFLSQPTENVFAMVSPVFKIPVEITSNKSTFFKNTLGERSLIERYPFETGTYLGLAMRKRTINLLKNIRLLNEIDKLNPGEIWGTKEAPSIFQKVLGERSVTVPGIGPISTAQQRGTSYTPDTDPTGRILQSFVGKTQLYDPKQSAQFYQWDTETRISEYNRAIKSARSRGQEAFAQQLERELEEFKTGRYKVEEKNGLKPLSSRKGLTPRF